MRASNPQTLWRSLKRTRRGASINIEALQQEAYDLGAEGAKNQMQPQIDQLENQLDLIQPMIQQ